MIGGGVQALCESYWIPGRRDWRPSMPIPPDGSTDAAADLDLMWLPGNASARHLVWLGPTEATMQRSNLPLNFGCNVERLLPHKMVQGSPLKANSSWFWRVDEVDAHSKATVRGAVWRLIIISYYRVVLTVARTSQANRTVMAQTVLSGCWCTRA